jgi:hypothetical protein
MALTMPGSAGLAVFPPSFLPSIFQIFLGARAKIAQDCAQKKRKS